MHKNSQITNIAKLISVRLSHVSLNWNSIIHSRQKKADCHYKQWYSMEWYLWQIPYSYKIQSAHSGEKMGCLLGRICVPEYKWLVWQTFQTKLTLLIRLKRNESVGFLVTTPLIYLTKFSHTMLDLLQLHSYNEAIFAH